MVMPQPVTIRRLQANDITAIREIDRHAFSAGEQYAPQFYDAIVNDTRFNAFVAEHKLGIVGWALLDKNVRPVRLRSLSVHPQFQRRGFAKALVEHIIACRDEAVDLLVRSENANAIALYEKCGFTFTTPDPEMPDRLRMIKPVQRASWS